MLCLIEIIILHVVTLSLYLVLWVRENGEWRINADLFVCHCGFYNLARAAFIFSSV